MITAVKQLCHAIRPRRESAVRARHGDAIARIKRTRERLGARADAELRAESDALRAAWERGDRSPQLDADAVAVISESIRRTHRLVPYDVQFIAGLVLAGDNLAEMATGEGKTLVALLPAFRFAFEGRGVHVATVNPYLAKRDFEFARPALERVGVTVGLLPDEFDPAAKRAAYACDITYGVGTEFGFDYLRDQLAIREAFAGRNGTRFHEILLGREPVKPRVVQRQLAFAIIDEADSVLIDEARSPLIISAGERKPSPDPQVYHHAQRAAESLKPGADFETKRGERGSKLTESGMRLAQAMLPAEVLPLLRRPWHRYVESALLAVHQMRRDVHYVVRDEKVVIVDEFTGRLCPERSWREGIHQAVEAHAGVPVNEENSSEVAITRPAYFRLYDRICGMTGTALEAADELRASYDVETVVIPLHRPCRRILMADRVFVTRSAKLEAIVRDVAVRTARSQPVLIGTRTVENSEAMAEKLAAAGVPFRLLNAKQDAEEARIISTAGEPGTVTIATNMAGRGAHIPLPTESERAGGLHVIGLERHESSRIDRQLIGRCARQGEPGSAQFFLSIEDDLLKRHAPAEATRLATTAPARNGELPSGAASHFLQAQRRAEIADREQRRQLTKYDESLDELKQVI